MFSSDCWLHNSVNILKTIELHTLLNGWIIWYVNYILTKAFLKKKKFFPKSKVREIFCCLLSFPVLALLPLLHPHFKSAASKEHSVYSRCCHNVRCCRNILYSAEVRVIAMWRPTHTGNYTAPEVRQKARARRTQPTLEHIPVVCRAACFSLSARLYLDSVLHFAWCFVRTLPVDFFLCLLSNSFWSFFVPLKNLPFSAIKHIWNEIFICTFQLSDVFSEEKNVFGQS